MKKVYIKTFGCQMNEYDTDKMHDVLRDKNGYIKTENIDEADIVLLNTLNSLYLGIKGSQFSLSQFLAAALNLLTEQHADFFGGILRSRLRHLKLNGPRREHRTHCLRGFVSSVKFHRGAK